MCLCAYDRLLACQTPWDLQHVFLQLGFLFVMLVITSLSRWDFLNSCIKYKKPNKWPQANYKTWLMVWFTIVARYHLVYCVNQGSFSLKSKMAWICLMFLWIVCKVVLTKAHLWDNIDTFSSRKPIKSGTKH